MVAGKKDMKSGGDVFVAKFDFAVDYLQKQFPWFSKSEILEAIDRFGYNHDKIVNYLNSKSRKDAAVGEE